MMLSARELARVFFAGESDEELIEALVRDARAHGRKAVVVTFDPDPDVVVSPSPAQKLMTTADRLHALAQTGVDAVVAVTFTPEVAALDHVGFLALLSRVVDIRSIRVGSDFRLGRGGASGVAEMRSWGSEHGAMWSLLLSYSAGRIWCVAVLFAAVTRVLAWAFPRQTCRFPTAFRCQPMACMRVWCWSMTPRGPLP